MIIRKFFSGKYLSLIISLFVFYITISILSYLSLGQTGGHFLYTLDDPYIHMAIAKNFVNAGTWGITRYEFSSCSSSPLWTFLISIFYFIFGTKEVIPFILNIVFASLTALAALKFLIKFTQNTFILTLVLLSVLFFGPLVSVVFTGLEHSMYTMFIVLAVFYVYKVFNGEYRKKDIYILYFIILLLTLSRYEGMFFAFALFVVFLYRKKSIISILILAFSFLPILLAGFISLSKGWYFFPNSVMLKSPVVFTDFGSFTSSLFNPKFFELLWAYKRILILLVISIIMFFVFFKDKDCPEIKSLILAFAMVVLLHVQFAKLGSLLRYEMYIIVFGILVNIISILTYIKNKNKNLKYSAFTVLIFLIIPFSVSSYKAMKDVPTAMTNVYQMQFQMSGFINKYYDKSTVALNDIGAINYYCNIHCVDMWGLANKKIADLRRNNNYDSDKIYEINRESKTEIAIVFDSWFEKYGGIPQKWLCAGKWTIPDNITCGADSVTFYATDSANYIKLSNNLRSFSKELPAPVKQKSF